MHLQLSLRAVAAVPLVLAVLPSLALADPPRVEAVDLSPSGGTWTVAVTLSHADTGWDDYADGWRVETEGGAVLATRELLHPHVEEQPFTRALSGVTIPAGVTEIWVRARTKTDGWSKSRTKAAVP